jgi:hypothetical protein
VKSGSKKYIFVLSLAFLQADCSPQTTGPQRMVENGIEIIVNGPPIYPDDGRARTISLQEEFRLDIEDAAMTTAGLTDIATIDFDSRSNLYVFKHGANSGPVVFLFDKAGKFSKSFVTIGQGPEEVGFPEFLGINARDEILIINGNSRSLQVFDTEGRLLRSIHIPDDLSYIRPKGLALLPNDDYLIRYLPMDRNPRIEKIRVGLFDNHFKKIKDLAEYSMPVEIQTPFPAFPITTASKNSIFLGSFDPGNEISVFDLSGELKQKIRLSYPTAPIPSEFKEAVFAALPKGQPWRATMTFPAAFPHQQAFFTDDENRLYGVSFEKDPISGANLCDVFSPNGTRIARVSLGYYDFTTMLSMAPNYDVVIRNGRLVCVRGKTNGFKEIIVYTMIQS